MFDCENAIALHYIYMYKEPTEVEWGGGWERERFKMDRTHIYLWLSHVFVWQKPTQHCKVIILQLRTNLKRRCISMIVTPPVSHMENLHKTIS